MQTVAVASGRDRFYAFNRGFDETGALVNWTVETLRSVPPEATLLVLPEGSMINYLSRHVNPIPALTRGAERADLLRHIQKATPDYIVVIAADPRQHGISPLVTAGSPWREVLNCIKEGYSIQFSSGIDPFGSEPRGGGVAILRRNRDQACGPGLASVDSK